ncbi:MAG TPA: hypothetical protein VGH72_33665 [Pseudonocardia sp.]|jgi:hypothetical protein
MSKPQEAIVKKTGRDVTLVGDPSPSGKVMTVDKLDGSTRVFRLSELELK